jgi:FtsP/CotA-like multicopper oxidase with cupredoxin domain
MMKWSFILLLLPIVGWSQIDDSRLIIARNTGTKIMPNNDTIGTMGFALSLLDNPNIPGPLLEFMEGDSIAIDLWNISQGAPHSIHLHGLDVNQQNDGVPHLSFDVAHMDHGFYTFKAPHAGTYLYHCHVISSVHVQAGMYGMIIVHPQSGENYTWDGGYEFDLDFPMMFSEIDTVWHNDNIMKHPHDTSLAVHTQELPIYAPQYYMVNGMADNQIVDSSFQLNTAVNHLNYVRLVNIGFKGVRVIFPAEFDAKTIDSDGRPLPNLVNSDTVEVYPGERYGVLGTMLNEGISQMSIEYFDLNTGLTENTQYVPIVVSGFNQLDKLELNWQVSPNPFSESIMISGNFENAQIKILNLNGQLIDEISIYEKSSFNYSTENMAPGVYIIQLNSAGNSFSKKVVKR